MFIHDTINRHEMYDYEETGFVAVIIDFDILEDYIYPDIDFFEYTFIDYYFDYLFDL